MSLSLDESSLGGFFGFAILDKGSSSLLLSSGWIWGGAPSTHSYKKELI
jgi:hypothetical protein